MAGSKRPSFLKRQKEQARLARAAEKRAARLERRHAKANGLANQEPEELDIEPMVEAESEEPPTEEA